MPGPIRQFLVQLYLLMRGSLSAAGDWDWGSSEMFDSWVYGQLGAPVRILPVGRTKHKKDNFFSQNLIQLFSSQFSYLILFICFLLVKVSERTNSPYKLIISHASTQETLSKIFQSHLFNIYDTITNINNALRIPHENFQMNFCNFR